MDRTKNSLVNFAFCFLTGYGIAARLRDRRTGLRVGVVLGLVGAVVSWIGYEKPAFLDSGPDDGDAEPIEIDVQE